jgi:hypothetical protein
MNIRMTLLVLVGASVLPRMAVAQVVVEPAKAAAVEAAPGAAAAAAAAPVVKPAPAVVPVVVPSSNAAPDAGAAFVDRDGDGIQDGQEHRFRKHGKGVLGHGATGAGTGSGTMRRFQGGPGGNGSCQDGGK